ncbi:MAG: DNA topoisomerase VI subunit B [Candidatus Aenigmatarchaeota archaeon]|nr:MAG: DNA topoisomerase VI subunit B [Candidatus Aenigmarchaeota archaeon]
MPENNGKIGTEIAPVGAREISISEFFEKNRHLLGYDNGIKALLIIVKEGVDNALDATEETRILPDVYVKVEELEKEKYKIIIKDNGPGIKKNQIPKIFGTLLYGSKFHRLRQSRGQQGLGISCAVLYSQLTTGEPTEVVSSTGDGKTHRYKLKIDVKKNQPMILEDNVIEGKDWHGLQMTFICEGTYREHKQSVLEYIKQTAISNPYANIIFDAPTGRFEFKRGVDKLPKEPKEIKPHLYGVEVGILHRMLKDTKARSLGGFLTSEFSRIGKTVAKELLKKAEIVDDKGEPFMMISPRKLTDSQVVSLVRAVKETKLMRPPTDCLSPLGMELIEEGMKKELNPEFVTAVTRPPAVYRGWPFQIEVGIAYAGSIDEPKFMRFANRVPLLYQSGSCAITKSISKTDWKRYGIQSEKMPTDPMAIFVHMASVWVPFTSESKEAIASYSIIIKEIKLALQEAARKLSIYLSGIRKAQYQAERKSIFERYAHETAVAISELTGRNADEIEADINELVKKNIKIMELSEQAKERIEKRTKTSIDEVSGKQEENAEPEEGEGESEEEKGD